MWVCVCLDMCFVEYNMAFKARDQAVAQHISSSESHTLHDAFLRVRLRNSSKPAISDMANNYIHLICRRVWCDCWNGADGMGGLLVTWNGIVQYTISLHMWQSLHTWRYIKRCKIFANKVEKHCRQTMDILYKPPFYYNYWICQTY